MVYRIYTEKKKGLDDEARALCAELRGQLGLDNLTSVRIINRYDVENITKEIFDKSVSLVFSEPQLDDVYGDLPDAEGAEIIAVEYLPGQFDQRADSASQCIQLLTGCERPLIKSAKLYYLYGKLCTADVAKVAKQMINPVESREASLDMPETLEIKHDVPPDVKVLTGFTSLNRQELESFVNEYSLAMDADDIAFCQSYFLSERRDPTLTEIRMLDTYWSDHCRHTTFLTTVDEVEIDDAQAKRTYDEYIRIRAELNRTKPVNLMDIATIGARYLKKKGKLPRLDESEEINACTVKIDVQTDTDTEEWLLLFKNETHNHPTEIEPFGGAATCIGGAIRDPLSGRAYVYQAMRITGAGDPRLPLEATIPGKLPQRRIVTTAAAGYSSYGNQIGLATGLVDELYHPGYVAKRLEIGAVVGAAPVKNVRREVPDPGDIVVLLGGRTGRDGCGGATGSSKSHTAASLSHCGAEVQKGNAPEERKLQRLMRNPAAAHMIKRCNDFGAGGVSVAIGELADGLEIDLDKVPKKYEGLDGTELAISESQERMAVVLSPEDVASFIELAKRENLEATRVAVVTDTPRLVMRHRGRVIVDISRDFLNSNGAEKHTKASVPDRQLNPIHIPGTPFEKYKSLCGSLMGCSRRGLSERFDSTIGAGTVLMPFGGKYQRTPAQVMAAKIPVTKGKTDTCSVMAWGGDPFLLEQNQYVGAYCSVVDSVSKLIASGAGTDEIYLTFQEYFEKPRNAPERWGKPLASLLGALQAQLDLGIAAIGGKDSMSGTFENIDVPPTLVSFAVTTADASNIISPEFKMAGSRVVLVTPEYKKRGIPDTTSLQSVYEQITKLIRAGSVRAAYAVGVGGVAGAVFKMAIGNRIGFSFEKTDDIDALFANQAGSFVLETADDTDIGVTLGYTTEAYDITLGGECFPIAKLEEIYEGCLESVYPCNIKTKVNTPDIPDYRANNRSISPAHITMGTVKPTFLIPVFPGTNCEYDTARAIERAGGKAEIFVINNLSSRDVISSAEEFARRIEKAQVIFIPGGFSGGDEPEGSGKFITAFFRNPAIEEATHNLLYSRDGLMGGICNGFQALIKLGLVPYGKITKTDADCPTLTYNVIGRHQSKLVPIRVCSNKSPWMMFTEPGEVYNVAISHGEGRFICRQSLLDKLIENGQIMTRYCTPDGVPTGDIQYNPNGSVYAVEGITSSDGRVFGKMGHTERSGENLYKNVPGNSDMKLFEGAVEYYRL